MVWQCLVTRGRLSVTQQRDKLPQKQDTQCNTAIFRADIIQREGKAARDVLDGLETSGGQ